MAELATAAEPRRRAWPAGSPSAAVTAVFFVSGVLFASWTAHIPHVKEYLRLNDGALGLALLGAPVGSVIAMLAVARLMPRLGSRLIVRITLTGYCLAGPLVGLAGSPATLFLALMLWGVFTGTLDVSMNTQAVMVERQARRPLMSGFHGAWSLGAFVGAGLGAAGVALGLSLSHQLLLLATPCLLVAGWLSLSMIPDQQAAPEDPAPERPAPEHLGPEHPARRRRSSGARSAWVAIGVLAGLIVADTLCEGAVGDWAAVYLHTSVGAPVALAALGYTAFSLTMVTFRLGGNRLLNRFAANKLLPALAGPAAVLFAVGLAVNDIPVVLVGFAALGIGLAVVYPVVMSATGRVSGINSGTAVALVAAFGWVGMVCGPVVIGQLANATSLRLALILVPVLTALIAVATATCRAVRSP